MKNGPDIARIAALAGEPARANMLSALSSGKALTASELALEAGVTPQTASSHLAKLEAGGLIAQIKQGRHRYFRLADGDVAHMLETMMGVAARAGHLRTRPGPADPAMRKARICYDHLAGEMGVQMFDSLVARGLIRSKRNVIALSRNGELFAEGFGIALDPLRLSRRPLCKTCLDWSMRRAHLAGALGAAFLDRIQELGWARRDRHSRTLLFNARGERRFRELFPDA